MLSSFGRIAEPEKDHSLTKVHMMLAGFAIENLCKGYLIGRLSREDQDAVRAGRLPKSLRTHDTLKLIELTEMTLSETEKYLVEQIDQAIWRGRYPSPTSYEGMRPFAEVGSDVRRIKAILRRLRGHVGAKKS